MDLFSAIIVILFVFFLIRGAWRGFSGELAPLAGITVCIGILWYGYTPMQHLLAAYFPTLEPSACVFYAAALITACGCAGFLLITYLVRKLVKCILPQPFNAILGALIGAAKVILFVSLAGGLFTMARNTVKEVREESERNPFMAVVMEFWVGQLEKIPVVRNLTDSTDAAPDGQKGTF